MIGQRRFQTYFKLSDLPARFIHAKMIAGRVSVQPDWDAFYDAAARRFDAVMLAVAEKLMRDDYRD